MVKKRDTKREFQILCAWCLSEGKKTVVGRSSVEGSHGICRRHEKSLKKRKESSDG